MKPAKHMQSWLRTLAVLSPLLSFAFAKNVWAEPIRTTENLRKEVVLIPPSAPDRREFLLVSFVTVAAGDQVNGWAAAYDDPTTPATVDYLELYEASGELLMITWTDQFGIQRTAVDRGLLQADLSELEGVLVLLPEGEPI